MSISRKEWNRQVKDQLTRRDMTQANLAKCIGRSPNYVRQNICGQTTCKPVIRKISEYLEIDIPDDVSEVKVS